MNTISESVREQFQAFEASQKRQTYRVTLHDLPLGAVVAMKREIWEFLGGPDVNGDIHAEVTLELGINEKQAERLSSFLDDGWMHHSVERVYETSSGGNYRTRWEVMSLLASAEHKTVDV